MKKHILFLLGLIATVATFTACTSSDDEGSSPILAINMSALPAAINLGDGTTYTLPIDAQSSENLSLVSVTVNGQSVYNAVNPGVKNMKEVKIDLSAFTDKTQSVTMEVVVKSGESVKSISRNVILNVPVLEASVEPCVTQSGEGTVMFSVSKGIASLDKAVIIYNGTSYELSLIDEKKTYGAGINDIVEGEKTATLAIYEKGKTGPSLELDFTVARYSGGACIFSATNDQEKFTEEYGGGLCQYKIRIDGNVIEFEKSENGYDTEYAPVGAKRARWTLERDGRGLISSVNVQIASFASLNEGFVYSAGTLYEFNYTDNGQIDYVSKDDEPFLTDFEYYEDGNLKQWKEGTRVHSMKYAEDANGNRVRISCVGDPSRTFTYTGKESVNPFFIPGLPPVISDSSAGLPLDLIYSPLLFQWDEPWTTTGNAESRKTEGKAKIGNANWTFKYIYNN